MILWTDALRGYSRKATHHAAETVRALATIASKRCQMTTKRCFPFPSTLEPEARIHVAGHRGLVGSAVLRLLKAMGHREILTASRAELDLRDPARVLAWFEENRPQYVIVAAGTVGGILANSTRPVDFLHDNLLIHAAVLRAAHRVGVEKLLYLGSSCIYPVESSQPMTEDLLLTGPFEPTNEPYALAKISGIRLCQAYRDQYGCRFVSALPTNLYGPHDNFDLESSHVVPALLRKFLEASTRGETSVTIWGSGRPRREFLHVDDLADACLFLLAEYDAREPINVGTGRDLTIRELAETIRDLVDPRLEIVFDSSRPDGMPRKRLDVSRLRDLGWRNQIDLRNGLASTLAWYRRSLANDHAGTRLGQSSAPPTPTWAGRGG